MISLLNNARLAAGKKPLGFLYPWLYSQGNEGFTDITDGNSVGLYGSGCLFWSTDTIYPKCWLERHERMGPSYWSWNAEFLGIVGVE